MAESNEITMPFSYRVAARNVMIFALVALVFGEVLFRKRYAEPQRTATPEILEIQQYLTLHPTLGFTWKPNIPASDGITFADSDAEQYPLSTDEWGFINSPEALAARVAGTPVDIIGLGDSFMEHAAPVLTGYFAAHGLSYYNLAMHRQSPIQFTDTLELYGIGLRPKYVVYSVYENDFHETVDYLNWTNSKMDWFSFHSGTWCGTPLPLTTAEKVQHKYLPGYTSLLNVIKSKAGIGSSDSRISARTVSDINASIFAARDLAKKNNIQFVLLFIPSRESVLNGLTTEALAYDRLDYPAIDLREVFANDPDPASLYYRTNGHWNPKGIIIAAEHILSDMNAQEADSTP